MAKDGFASHVLDQLVGLQGRYKSPSPLVVLSGCLLHSHAMWYLPAELVRL